MMATLRRVAYPSGSGRFSGVSRGVCLGLLLALEAGFGSYYAWSEFRKGAHFDPFQSPSEFREHVLAPAVNADIPAGDLEAYLKAANSIAIRGNDTLESGLPSAWVTPGYPLALAGTFRIFGFHFGSILLLNTLAWGVAFIACASTAASLGLSTLEISVALFLFASNLRMSMFIGYMYTECLFLAFIASFLAVYLKMIRSADSPRFGPTLALGLIAGYGALVRPIFLGIALPLILIGPFLRSPRGWTSWLLALALSVAPMGAWVFRNTNAFGFPLISTSSALAQAEGAKDFYLNHPVVGIFPAAPRQFPFDFPAIGQYDPHPELNLFLAAREWTKRWNSEHTPAEKAHLLVQRVVALFSPFIEAMSTRNREISMVYWLVLSPLSLLGLVRFRREMLAWILFGACFLLIFLPSLVVVGPSLRYQIPGQILLAPLAAVGLVSVFRRKEEVQG